jgi:HK97 family phage portal protein
LTFTGLRSDGTPTGTALAAEERVLGEELWLPPGPTALVGITVTERTALQLASVLAMANTLATDVAVLPLDVYQKMPDKSRRDASEYPVSRLLRITPDGETTPILWKGAWMLHALLYGSGYAEIQRRGRGAPYALHLLDPCSTQVKRVGTRLGYEIDGGRKWIEAANVLHLSGLSFDGLSGLNFVRLLRQAIGLGLAAEGFAAQYFANGSEPNGIIKHPHRLKGEALAEFRAGWEREQGGYNRHRTAMLFDGAEWQQTTTDPEKSQILDTRKHQVLDTIRPWRMPPHKAGDYSEAHLANIEASNLDYLQTALMGWLTTIEQQADFKLFSRAEQDAGYYCKHNVNAILRANIEARYRTYEIALRNGLKSRNEVRAMEEDNPMPEGKGGDLYTVQMQNVPLEMVGKTPTAGPAAPGRATDDE